MKKLMEMLTYKRPADSESEKEFIEKFIVPCVAIVDETVVDDFGNIFYRIGEGKTLFCAHTDTVHRTAGRQLVSMDDKTKLISVVDGECLGADDGAGVWLLLEMIEAGVQGWYAFYRCEEKGGQGSSFSSSKSHTFYAGIERGVAFDRRGISSVITHQAQGRCCSDEFANALADELNANMVDGFMSPDDTGIFTDTANLTDLIGECTNISTGYDHEHSNRETQDAEFLSNLRDACIAVKWEALPCIRKAGEIAPDDKWDMWAGYGYGKTGVVKLPKKKRELRHMSYGEMVAHIKSTPPLDLAEEILELVYENERLEDLVAEIEAGYIYEDEVEPVYPNIYPYEQ